MISTREEEEVVSQTQDRLLINGVWVPAEKGRVFEVRDPSTGDVLRTVADASANDGIRALDAAVASQEQWAATSPRFRSDILRRAFDLVHLHKEHLALLMTLEMGKPLAESRHEVTYGADFLRWFSEESVRVHGRYGLNPEATGRIIISEHPVGPCFFVTPWNFPFAMATRKIAPALAAGCTMVIKPSELTPLTTLFFVALLVEAGLPVGVVNVVTTTRPSEVSTAIVADSRLRKPSFTGSTGVGRAAVLSSPA